MLEFAHKPKPPLRAALASWVELLNSQAGGGHNYEDVGSIFDLPSASDNNGNVLGFEHFFNRATSMASGVYVRVITSRDDSRNKVPPTATS
jgi:hypothetical protein